MHFTSNSENKDRKKNTVSWRREILLKNTRKLCLWMENHLRKQVELHKRKGHQFDNVVGKVLFSQYLIKKWEYNRKSTWAYILCTRNWQRGLMKSKWWYKHTQLSYGQVVYISLVLGNLSPWLQKSWSKISNATHTNLYWNFCHQILHLAMPSTFILTDIVVSFGP